MKQNLKTKVFNACKDIMKLDIRTSIKELIENLNKKDIGGMGSQYSLQFLRYLILNQNKEQAPIKIEGLSNDELYSMETLYFNFICIDKKILSLLNKHFENSDRLIPYYEFNYTFQSKNLKGDVLSDKIMSDSTSEFINHPAFKVIDKCYKEEPQIHRIPVDGLLKAIKAFEKKISTVGIFDVPPDFSDMRLFQGNKSEAIFAKTIFAIVALRASIRILNQLLYQAFIMDTLFVLDNSNVFHIVKDSSNIIGDSIQLKSVLDEKIGFPNPGSIIKVKLKRNNYLLDDIYQLETSNFHWDVNEGATYDLGLRKVDDNLCYFSNLI